MHTSSRVLLVAPRIKFTPLEQTTKVESLVCSESSWRCASWMIHYAGGRSDRQIGSGWSRVSLSVVLVSRVITLGTPGVSGCCSVSPFPDSDICQIFQLGLPHAVQRETVDLRLVKAEVAIVEASKVTRCWKKNRIYSNLHHNSC